MGLTSAGHPRLVVELGPDSAASFPLGLPVLSGDPSERIFGAARRVGTQGDFTLFQDGHWRLGAATVPVDASMTDATTRVYDSLFAATCGLNIARIWNYLPKVNEHDADGLENYRAFCLARSLAFERQHGLDFAQQAPAASAVGSDDANLQVVFAATADPVRHIENPRQVPAYRYPRQYGPRPPTFSRATVAQSDGATVVFISGTAAIRGHTTIQPGDTLTQLACTLENLGEIATASGLGANLAAETEAKRFFKIYLRNPHDTAAVAAELERHLLRPGDHASYLRSDICRADLMVEIEATIILRTPAPVGPPAAACRFSPGP